MRTSCARLLCALTIAMAGTGCSGGLTGFIVDQRNHQGDLALGNGNAKEALLAYRLAIDVDARNEHARTGLARAEIALAEEAFERKALSREGFNVPFLELNHAGHRIWGATAGILWNLRQKLLAA